MSHLYSGYQENQSMTDQRAFSRAMEASGYKIQRSTSTLLNTEAEVDNIYSLIQAALSTDDPRTPAEREHDEAGADLARTQYDAQ